jgi:cupin fold WbuC family metalloprotein
VGVVCFDDSGTVTDRFLLDAEGAVRGVDLPPGIWHTVLALSESSVCYEVKPGPWEPASDKDFADWAPAEQTPEAAEFVIRMEALFSR